MRECLTLPGVGVETREDRSKIKFKDHQVNLKDLPLHSRTYEAPKLNREGESRIGTSGQNHRIG